MTIRIKRVYDPPAEEDGTRVLVDRLWPRGLARERARIDEWLKELAPSAELRTWYGHDPKRWEEFRMRYREELADRRDLVERLRREADKETVTLLFAARDGEHSNAAVLRELLSRRSAPAGRRKTAPRERTA